MENQQAVCVKMVTDVWNSKATRLDKLLSELSDEQLMHEVSPGRNRGVYLLGHLAGVTGHMIQLLGFSENNATPDLMSPFVEAPDNRNAVFPPTSELRREWTRVKDLVAERIAAMQPEEWFQKHTSVSAEDFAKEPHRNRLNVLLTRASHLDYHLGQLIFLKGR